MNPPITEQMKSAEYNFTFGMWQKLITDHNLLFFSHQHKATGFRHCSKQGMTATVSKVLRKATAFPLWRAIDNCWKRKVDSLGSPVIKVAWLPISWTSSTVQWFQVILPPVPIIIIIWLQLPDMFTVEFKTRDEQNWEQIIITVTIWSSGKHILRLHINCRHWYIKSKQTLPWNCNGNLTHCCACHFDGHHLPDDRSALPHLWLGTHYHLLC